MRTLLLLILGGLAGVVATVMFISVDTTFEGGGSDGPGGGNVRIAFLTKSRASSTINSLLHLQEQDDFEADTTVAVTVHNNGLIDVAVGVGVAPVGVVTELVLDPGVVEGELAIELVDARVGGVSGPDELATIIEALLQEQIADVTRGFEYRLTAITTANRQLTPAISGLRGLPPDAYHRTDGEGNRGRGESEDQHAGRREEHAAPREERDGRRRRTLRPGRWTPG
ncbi:MAG: hypothetical protein U5Q44_13700 [Dehalococcoidia bacterium]|nr:hypothetical protein [Dehalococcoidia bacterium]